MASTHRRLRVFPDAERVEQALIEAADEGDGLVDASCFQSFSQLVESLEGARQLSRRACSELACRVLVAAEARALPQGPYRSFAHEPAFARAALELFFELKAGACEPAEFHRAAAALGGGRGERAEFLAKLYSAYQARLAHLGLADREDLLAGAELALEKGLPRALRGFGAVELHELHDFSPSRLRLVLRLAQRCQSENVEFLLELPGAGRPELDAPVDSVAREFERRWQSLEVEVRKRDLKAEGRPFAELGERLFSTNPVKHASSSELFGFSAGSVRGEAYELARRARAFVDHGAAPEEIVIAFRDLSSEAGWVAEAIEELGLRARYRLGAPLFSTTVGRLALELPRLLEEHFPADFVARLLESRYAPAVSQGLPQGIAAWLARASVRDDLIGARDGKGAYQVRLSALAERHEAGGSLERARAARKVGSAVEKLKAITSKLPEEAPAAELLACWRKALVELGLFTAVRRGEAREEEGSLLGRAVSRALARDQAALEALEELSTELAAAFEQAGLSKQRTSRAAFHRWLFDAAGDFNLANRGPKAGAVRVLDLRELPGARARHVLVGGLVDGRFPGRNQPRALLPDEDRAKINSILGREVFRLSAGEGEARITWRLAEDRFLLHQALGAAEETITFSFAQTGATGQQQLASPFLDELARVAGLSLEHVPDRAVVPLDAVACEAKLRERVTLEALAPLELRSSEPDPARELLKKRFAGEPWFEEASALAAIEEERLRYFTQESLPPGQYTGRVDAEKACSELESALSFGPERPLSASQLGRFGNCAFQGFLSHGLGLIAEDPVGEELDGRGRGSYWHSVLEKLFSRLEKADLLGRSLEQLPPQLIEEVLDEAGEQYAEREHPGHPALWPLQRERARNMVRELLATPTNGLPFEGHRPKHTELLFGKSEAPSGWRQIVLPASEEGETPVHFSGSIDRLDQAPGAAAIIDYKSGKLEKLSELTEALVATSFQLPLYLYAARTAGLKGQLRAAWLNLKEAKVVDFQEVLDEAGLTLEELLATSADARAQLANEHKPNFANAVHGLLKTLRRGEFPARAKSCEYCSFGAVCRTSERRLLEEDEGE